MDRGLHGCVVAVPPCGLAEGHTCYDIRPATTAVRFRSVDDQLSGSTAAGALPAADAEQPDQRGAAAGHVSMGVCHGGSFHGTAGTHTLLVCGSDCSDLQKDKTVMKVKVVVATLLWSVNVPVLPMGRAVVGV